MPKFERTIDVPVPVDTVWSIISNTSQWSRWLPGVDAVSGLGGLQSGATFSVQAGEQSGEGTVEHVEPGRAVTIVTQIGGDQDRHTISVRQKRILFGLLPGGGSQVTYTLDTMMRRGPIGEFIAAGNPMDALKVKGSLDKLRGLVDAATGKA